MKVCILYYDGFCEFETVFAAAFFKSHSVAAALEDRVYVSEENQRYLPDTTIDKLDTAEIDLLIIPGGDPSSMYQNEVLKDFVIGMNNSGKYISGICGGTYLMAAYGILNGKNCTGGSSGLVGTDNPHFAGSNVSNDDVVTDGNTVTATGQAYVEFAFELVRIFNLCPDQEKFHAEYRWCKNIK